METGLDISDFERNILMKNEERIIEALQSQITNGRFKSPNELALFLGLTETTKSKLYNVLNRNINAGYKTICEWFDKLNISLLAEESQTDKQTERTYYNVQNSNESPAQYQKVIQTNFSANANYPYTQDSFLNPSQAKNSSFEALHATIKRINENAPYEYVEGDSLHHIPVYGYTGAGGEVELIENEPIAIISILPQYNILNMYPLKVDGDSMYPTIPKGSYVGVVPYSGNLQEGGVYLIERKDLGRMIKRIKLNENGILSVYSDNPEYKSIPLKKILADGQIVGQVMWILRMP